MSKLCMGIAVLGISVLLLPTVSLSPAQAIGLRIGINGGPIGIVRFAASRMLGLRALRGRHYAGRGAREVGLPHDEATAPRMDIARGADAVASPLARVQIAAVTALSGWHSGRNAKGWWRHEDGGYGWVGPLYWPFAYYDIYDYAVWGDGMGFWGYGYRDIYSAIFTPYDFDELARYAAPPHGRRHARLPALSKLCGDDSGEVATLPTDEIRQAIRLMSEEQTTVLSDLANTSVDAAQIIRSACRTEPISTAAGRLAAMQQRLEAMKSAIASIRTPFEKFYELLDDEQKGELNAFASQRTEGVPKVPLAQSCTAPEAFPWPGSEIEARLQLNDTQREAAEWLSQMSARAKDTLNFDCQPDESLAPPDRLATADTRLDAMLDAIRQIKPALEQFEATLSDEQKAQFEAIGPRRSS